MVHTSPDSLTTNIPFQDYPQLPEDDNPRLAEKSVRTINVNDGKSPNNPTTKVQFMIYNFFCKLKVLYLVDQKKTGMILIF